MLSKVVYLQSMGLYTLQSRCFKDKNSFGFSSFAQCKSWLERWYNHVLQQLYGYCLLIPDHRYGY